MALRGAGKACLGAISLASMACGGGPQLAKLRCRTVQACQDVEDPFRLLLAVDFEDPKGTLRKGQLAFSLDGKVQTTLPLEPLFAKQNIPEGAVSGTLLLEDELVIERVTRSELRIGAIATDAAGKRTNEAVMGVLLTLGTP